jgi:hypothetical protein
VRAATPRAAPAVLLCGCDTKQLVACITYGRIEHGRRISSRRCRPGTRVKVRKRWAAHHCAPAAKHESAKRPQLACPRPSAPRTATSHTRCCYLVVTGSAIRIRVGGPQNPHWRWVPAWRLLDASAFGGGESPHLPGIPVSTNLTKARVGSVQRPGVFLWRGMTSRCSAAGKAASAFGVRRRVVLLEVVI